MARVVRKDPKQLTALEVKVLALSASGLNYREIAQALYMSYSAVCDRAYSVKQKLGVDTLTAAAMRAHALGYLSHPTGPDLTVVALDA